MSDVRMFLLGFTFCILSLSIIIGLLCLIDSREEENKIEKRDLLEKHIRKGQADYILDSAKYRKITAEEIAILTYIIERYLK